MALLGADRLTRLVDSRKEVASGQAVAGLEELGQRYAATIRVVTLVPTVLVAVLAADTATRGTVVTALAGVSAWSGVYVWAVRGRRCRVPLSLVDTAVLCAVALGSAELVPGDWFATGKSWLLPFLAFAGVAYQYSCPRRVALSCALALAAAALVGSAWALPPGASTATVVTAGWNGAIAILAMLLWELVRRGGMRADSARADLEDAEQDRRVAAAVRHDQRSLSATLHDTAASTLLMVGLGDGATDRGRLADRARRDLAVLSQTTSAVPATCELSCLLQEIVAATPLAVRLVPAARAPALVEVPTEIADALAGAVTEALNNVARHADATDVELSWEATASGRVLVRVVDDGVGFDPAASAVAGRGLRESIRARMDHVGGAGSVVSALGTGTLVRLEWPCEHANG